MLSANLIGDANAHHQIRHRARHGLRGGVASPLQRFALVVPCRRPRRPRHRPRQQSCHVLCSKPGALAPSMRHTHRVNACRRLVRRVTPMNRGSMVSSIRLRTTNGEGRREKRLSSAKARSACGGEARDGDVSQQPGKLDSSASSGKSTPPNGGSLDRAQKGLLRGPISQNPWEALPQ